VTEESQVGEARRAAAILAASLGFDAIGCGEVALVVTEAANNQLKHARRGKIVLRPLEEDGVVGIEILALDQGAGMADVRRCQLDGFSTATSPGTGLGAMARLADFLDLYSLPQAGTALVARLWARAPRPALLRHNLQVAALSLPKQGQEVCGDNWAVHQDRRRTLCLVVDGLGHGPLAADRHTRRCACFTRSTSVT